MRFSYLEISGVVSLSHVVYEVLIHRRVVQVHGVMGNWSLELEETLTVFKL